MKKILAILLTVFITVSSVGLVAFANDDIKVVIDGNNQSYDQMPQIMNDRTLVPLRGIFEALGAKVSWVDETKTIIGSKGDKTIVLQVGNTTASMNNEMITLDAAPAIVNSRTMVPVRFISETLGARVDWVADTRTVVITSPNQLLKEREENRTANGEVILDAFELINNTRKTINGGVAEINTEDNKFYVNVKTLPAKDLDVNTVFKAAITATVKQSDVCLISFKARLISGGENGTGYIKVWAQSDTGTKALFARTSFGSEWTECYLPFIGIKNMNDIGMRFGGMVQEIEIKDFEVINYGPKKDITTLKSTFITGEENTVIPNMTKSNTSENTSEKEETPSDTVIDSKNGTVIIDSTQFKKNSSHSGKGMADFKFNDDVLTLNIHTLPAKDMDVLSTINIPLSDIIKQSDICLMSFKARLTSGGENGVGYIKAWVQNDKSTKALFARTDVKSEWTDCYLPFVGIANLSNMGFRYGGMVQGLEIKDFKVINYGPDKNIKSLKSTALRGENTVSPLFIDDIPVADASGIDLNNIPEEGIVIVDNNELTGNYTTNIKGYADVTTDNNVLKVNVHTLPAKDLQATVALKTPLKNLIRQSDICLVTFKARITSGGDNGVGYAKVYVQNTSNGKALFARTNVGKEWTDCYLPFVGIADMNSMGIRFGGMVQQIEIKDFKVINYGPNKDIKSLKSTVIRDDNTVAPVIP